MRAFYAFMNQGFRMQMAYKVEGVIGIFQSLIWFLLYAGIWTALLRNDPAALRQQMVYIIATRFLSELFFLPTWEIAMKFRMGDVGLELIKPVSLPVRILADFLGRSGFRLLRSLPVYVLIWAVFRLPAPSLFQLVLFVLSSLLGWVIVASAKMALNLIALWTVQFNQAEEVWDMLSSLFAGAFIPLHYLPPWVAGVARYLPFAGVYYVPSAILSGGLGGGALVQAMGLQVLWAFVMASGLWLMWQAGSRKLVMQGG